VTTGFTAGSNQKALINVSGTAYAPAGNYGLGVYPMYSVNGGSWIYAHSNDQRNYNDGTSAKYVSASNTAVLNLSAGNSYRFAVGVWDAPGPGYTSPSCPCSTSVIIGVN